MPFERPNYYVCERCDLGYALTPSELAAIAFEEVVAMDRDARNRLLGELQARYCLSCGRDKAQGKSRCYCDYDSRLE